MFEFNGAQAWSIGLAWTDFVHNLQYTETTETEISAPGVVSVVVDISTGDTLSINEGPVAGVEERQPVRRPPQPTASLLHPTRMAPSEKPWPTAIWTWPGGYAANQKRSLR